MLTLTFFIKIIFDSYLTVLLLRIWMQCSSCDFHNSLSQLVIKTTELFNIRFIPSIKRVNLSILFFSIFFSIIKHLFLNFVQFNFFFINFFIFFISIISLLQILVHLISWVIIIRSIRSWIIISYTDIDIVLFQLTEPLMVIIRRYIPPIGGIDLSGMILMILLYIFNYILKDCFPNVGFYL